MKKKIAVVLFNLGGPDDLSSVKGFLFNLFYDHNIIRIINPFRWIIAKIISTKREETSKDIYAQMGGKSTILPITIEQATKLEKRLNQENEEEIYKCFISMRYWKPFASETIKDIEQFSPDEVFLLPLYPQFSTTTTKSSFEEFYKLINKSFLKKLKTKDICCYYSDLKFIKAHVELIQEKIINLKQKYRILFSAHSLPEKIIKQGDPYQWQIEQTCKSIVKELNVESLDYIICYQSKVGPLKWLSPSTEEEIKKAAKEDIAVVIVPVAFVSEHSETLVELDIEYKKIFQEISTKPYIRVASLNGSDNYIEALVNQVNLMKKKNEGTCSLQKCPKTMFKDCFMNKIEGKNNGRVLSLD